MVATALDRDMAITNDQELVRAVDQASELVQSIQDYCDRTIREDSKINFPRGLIRTADTYRARFPAYLDREKTSNCSYAFMFLDVLWWLASRTDIASVAKQMVLKSAIVTLGTILEACLHVPKLPRSRLLSNMSSAGVEKRIENVLTRSWISKDESEVLKKLWVHRTNVHQKNFQTDSELDLYNADHVNLPHAALLNLLVKLKEWNGQES
jgi:hypothetical protein